MNTNELKIGDRVGIQPSGMDDQLYDFGTVAKLTKTQVTVKNNANGQLGRYTRSEGRMIGTDYWNPCRLVSVEEAETANARIRPILEKRHAHRLVSYRITRNAPDRFAQRQLDAALVALDEKYAGDLPPLMEDPSEQEAGLQLSEIVLVRLTDSPSLRFGQYCGKYSNWRVEWINDEGIEVVEWWPLP